MKIACLGGGPAGPLFRDQHEAARPRARHHRVRAQPSQTTPSAGAWCCPTRRSTTSPPTIRSAPRRSAPISPIGTTSRSITAASASSRAATASAASAASSCSSCCSSERASSASKLRFQTEIDSAAELAKTHDLVVAADGLNSRTRNEFAEHFCRTSTCARASSSGSARSRNSTTPSPSSSRRPSTAGSGRTPTSSTPTPRLSSSNARRRPGRSSASAR